MNVDFQKRKLKSGTVVLFEKRNLPVVAMSASVKFGSLYESEKIKGISHVMEHMMFKGTKTRTRDEIAREIEKKGGILNAYTGEEVTSYWNKLPSKHFNSGIDIATDLILNPKLDGKEFEKEKKVIMEEIKMYHDNPRVYAIDKIKEMLYEKPFGMSIAGTHETVKGIGIEQVRKLFSENYTSDSMILTVVGNADFSEIVQISEKLFPERKRKLKEPEIILRNQEEQEKRAGIDQSHFVLGFHSPCIGDVRRYAYDIGGAYLFGGMSSKLFLEIREKRGLAYSIRGDFDLGSRYGYCMIQAGLQKDKIKETRKIILKELANLKNLKQKDFEECREQLIGNKKIEAEDSVNSMTSLMIEEMGGNAEEHYQYEERINAVKLDDVRRIKLPGFSSFSLISE